MTQKNMMTLGLAAMAGYIVYTLTNAKKLAAKTSTTASPTVSSSGTSASTVKSNGSSSPSLFTDLTQIVVGLEPLIGAIFGHTAGSTVSSAANSAIALTNPTIISTTDAAGNAIQGYAEPVSVGGTTYNNSFTSNGQTVYLSDAQIATIYG